MGNNSEAKEIVTTLSYKEVQQKGKLLCENSLGKYQSFNTLPDDNVTLNYTDLLKQKRQQRTREHFFDRFNKLFFQFDNNIFYKKSQFNDKLIRINEKFKIEMSKFAFDNILKAKILKNFESVSTQVSKIKAEDLLIEIVNSSKIKFSFFLKDDCMLIITKPFTLENTLDDDNIVFYSFFNNDDDLLVSHYGEISSVIDGFKNYLQ